jgi:hypothetical protein
MSQVERIMSKTYQAILVSYCTHTVNLAGRLCGRRGRGQTGLWP